MFRGMYQFMFRGLSQLCSGGCAKYVPGVVPGSMFCNAVGLTVTSLSLTGQPVGRSVGRSVFLTLLGRWPPPPKNQKLVLHLTPNFYL